MKPPCLLFWLLGLCQADNLKVTDFMAKAFDPKATILVVFNPDHNLEHTYHPIFVDIIGSNHNTIIVDSYHFLHDKLRNNVRERPSNFIIVEEDLDSLNNTLMTVAKRENFLWNSRGYFLIVLRKVGEIREVFKVLLDQYNVYDVVILYDKRFYTWFPYTLENNCGNSANRVVRIARRDSTAIFGNKIPPDKFPGCGVRVTWNAWNLVITDPFEDTDSVLTSSLKLIAAKLNLTLHFMVNNTEYLRSFQHNNVSDLLADIKRRKIDLLMFLRGDHLLGEMEFTQRVAWDAVVFVLPQRKHVNAATKLVKVFGPTLWLLVGLTTVLATICWKLTERHSYVHSVLRVLQVMVQSSFSVNSGHARSSWRLLFWALSFYAGNLATIYLAKVSSTMTVPSLEPKINSMAELADSGLYLDFSPVVGGMLKTLGSDIFAKLSSRNYQSEREVNSSDYDKLKRYTSERIDYGFSVVQNNFLYIKNPEQLEVLPDPIMDLSIGFYVRRGFPFKERLDWWILRLHEIGLLRHWYFKPELVYKRLLVQSDGNELRPLTVEHLMGVFWIWLYGLLIAFVVFVAEICVSRMKMRF